jgi:hypothetical protein
MSIDVSEMRAASIIALMMEAALTSETSVDIHLRTRQYIPEDSEIHISLFPVRSHEIRILCDASASSSPQNHAIRLHPAAE